MRLMHRSTCWVIAIIKQFPPPVIFWHWFERRTAYGCEQWDKSDHNNKRDSLPNFIFLWNCLLKFSSPIYNHQYFHKIIHDQNDRQCEFQDTALRWHVCTLHICGRCCNDSIQDDFKRERKIVHAGCHWPQFTSVILKNLSFRCAIAQTLFVSLKC